MQLVCVRTGLLFQCLITIALLMQAVLVVPCVSLDEAGQTFD